MAVEEARPGSVVCSSGDSLQDAELEVTTSGTPQQPVTIVADGATIRQGYLPAGWMSLRRILPPREVTDHDVFVDFGSGMGRVVLQAARYPFRKVIGVEISQALHSIAQENIDHNRQRLRCPDVELVHADALEYELPDDVSVAFLYNPFRGEIFATVIERLLQSVERNPRLLRIIYVNPVEERLLLGTGRIRHARTVSGWRPSKEWSRSNSIRMYEAVVAENAGDEVATQ